MAKQNIEAITKWQKENTVEIRFRVRKGKCMNERIQQALGASSAGSRQAFIIDAVEKELTRLGYPAPKEEQPEE